MLSYYRFSNPTQKEVHLATLRDLMVDNQEDQIAKTALSNAIAISESTIVTGDLDKMIEKTNRWYRRHTRILSVFFVVLALTELVFAGFRWAEGKLWASFGTLGFGVCVLVYCWFLRRSWSIQRQYHGALKYLEEQQLELPPSPISLRKVN